MAEQHLLSYATPEDPPIKRAVISSIEVLSGRKKLEKIYDSAMFDYTSGAGSFWESAIKHLKLNLEYDQSKLDQIPSIGPVVFVANHPFGVLDGLAICYLASKVRPNFKILIHAALCREERINEHLLPIDFSETKEAIQTNIQTKRDAMQTLKDGGAIVIFPAGGISTAIKPLGRGPVLDLEWKLFMAKMVKMTKSTVVPIYFHGKNGRMFQLVSGLSQTLRLSLIIREVKRSLGGTLKASIGNPISYDDLSHIKGREELTLFLRKKVYELGQMAEVAHLHATLDKPKFLQVKPSKN